MAEFLSLVAYRLYAIAIGFDVLANALTGGLNISWWFVSAINTVTVGLASTVTLGVGAAPIAWRVTAHR